MVHRNPLHKKLDSHFDHFSDPIRNQCGICKMYTSRVQTFRTLNALNHHVVTAHKTDGTPVSAIIEIKEIIVAIAKAKQLGVLP